ncbi:hypothetical protein KCP70_09190 [Salmonella enterica subsp. enterica]|nr:hypothetical protein KCP70_09190 [Salmonella enterica subsp. enterica]
MGGAASRALSATSPTGGWRSVGRASAGGLAGYEADPVNVPGAPAIFIKLAAGNLSASLEAMFADEGT